MEKLKRINYVGDEKTFDAQGISQSPSLIDEVILWLSEAKKKGATHIDWGASVNDFGDSEEVRAQLFYEYYESDEDFLKRAEEEERRRAIRQAQKLEFDKILYAKLKKQFDGR